MTFKESFKQRLIPQRSRDFDLDLLEKNSLEMRYTNGVREYLTPTGNWYKSVTTILSEQSKSTPQLEQWKKRVGEKEAERIRGVAGTRGTNLHKMSERFLMNEDNWQRDQSIINIENFKKIIPVFEENVGTIYGCELPLWSDYFKTAGTTDLLCEWKIPNFDDHYMVSIVDVKTSRSNKEKEDILNYFIQTSIYAYMASEIYDYLIDQIVIVLLVDNEPEPKVFIEDPSNFRSHVENIFLEKI